MNLPAVLDRPAPQVRTDHQLDVVVPLGGERIIVHRLEEGGTYDVNVEVGPGGSATVVTVNVADGSTSVTIRQRGTVAEGGSLHWRNATLALPRGREAALRGEGPQIRHTLRSAVMGNGGRSSIDWLFYAKGSERYTLDVRNVFTAREGSGDIVMRGVAEEEAHVACKGMIDIGSNGDGTRAFLTQEMLMLDATARIDAVPALEIKTNDVRASHSATVTKVSPEDLFYFGSRGIDEGKAREMFILGFLGSLVEKIEDSATREDVVVAIEGKFGKRSSAVAQ